MLALAANTVLCDDPAAGSQANSRAASLRGEATLNLTFATGNPVFSRDFWSAAPLAGGALEPNKTQSWLIPVSELERSGDVALLAGWHGTGGNFTYPLTRSASTVRILGGWSASNNPSILCCRDCEPMPSCVPPLCCQYEGGGPLRQCCNPADWSDLAYRAAVDSALSYRWEVLFARLDNIVANGIHPLVVLDNVPYAFVRQPTRGTFGQTRGPDNVTEYASFISLLVEQLVGRYGQQVGGWCFRVGTEPNNPTGHWNDTVEKYVEMYAAIARAVAGALHQAPCIGPGNFNPFTKRLRNPDKLNATVAIAAGLAAAGSPISFFAESFYGMARGSPSLTSGYDPLLATEAVEDLLALRTIAGKRNATLQLMEFGTLQNAHGRSSPEPGAFGGAWTLATSTRAAALGVTRAFHWDIFEEFGGARLYFSSAWLSTAMCRLFGSAPQRRPTLGEQAAVRVLAGGTATTPEAGGETTASGVAGITGNGSSVGLLVGLFNPDKQHAGPAVEAKVSFPCPVADCLEKPPAVRVWLLNKSTSTYDSLRRHAKAAGWLANDDGEVYRALSVPGKPGMLSQAGQVEAERRASDYFELQRRLFSPGGGEQRGVRVRCTAGGDGCVAHLVARPPTIWAVSVDWA